MKTTADKTPVVQFTLRQIIHDRGLTVQQVSEASGISRQNLYLMLRAPVAIRLDTLAKLCKALDVDVSSLLQYEEVKR